MEILKFGNLGARFMLELCVLASLGYWGFTLDKGLFVKWVCGIGAPLAAAIIWGSFVAPKSQHFLDDPLRLVVEILIFGAAILALFSSGKTGLAWLLAIAFIINRSLLIVWKQ
ncbi:YrdB family protein [Fredinandcohnia humi]